MLLARNSAINCGCVPSHDTDCHGDQDCRLTVRLNQDAPRRRAPFNLSVRPHYALEISLSRSQTPANAAPRDGATSAVKRKPVGKLLRYRSRPRGPEARD